MAGASGFGYLSSGAVPGSSHAIGACAPFTVWAVVPFSRGGSIIIIITRSVHFAGTTRQEMCVSPAQREACVQNATLNRWIQRI